MIFSSQDDGLILNLFFFYQVRKIGANKRGWQMKDAPRTNLFAQFFRRGVPYVETQIAFDDSSTASDTVVSALYHFGKLKFEHCGGFSVFTCSKNCYC